MLLDGSGRLQKPRQRVSFLHARETFPSSSVRAVVLFGVLMETPEEFEESIEMDACSYPARLRRAIDNGWPSDIQSQEAQYFDFQLGVWRFGEQIENRK